jgi:hypothetical protein
MISLAQQFHNTLSCFGAELLDTTSDLHAFWKPKVGVAGDSTMIVALFEDGSMYVRGNGNDPFYYIVEDDRAMIALLVTIPRERVDKIALIVRQAVERFVEGGAQPGDAKVGMSLGQATFVQGNMTLN